MTKLCKDCKWAETPSIPFLWFSLTLTGAPLKCLSPAPERTTTLTTGEYEWKFAEILRNDLPNFCGTQAKRFEPK